MTTTARAPSAEEPEGTDPWPPHWRELARVSAAWSVTGGAPPGSLALEAVLALTECGDLAGLMKLDNFARIRLGRPAPRKELPHDLDWVAKMIEADHIAMSAAGMAKDSIADVLARNLLAYVSSRRGPLRDRRKWVLVNSQDPTAQQTIRRARDAITEALSPTDLDAPISYGKIVKAGLAPWGYDTSGWYDHTRKAKARAGKGAGQNKGVRGQTARRT